MTACAIGRLTSSAIDRHIWRELRSQGRIDFHPAFPQREGWGARRIDAEADVGDVIAMLRLNYDRIVERHGLPADDRRPAGTPRIEPAVETTPSS